MKKAFVLVSMLFAGVALQAQSAETYPSARLLARFKFEQLSGGLVVLKARLDQHPDTLNFILDTGSGGISLDTFTALYLNLPLTPTERTVKGIGGIKPLHFYNGGTLHFQGLTVENLDFHINDYELLSEVYGIRVDGIIGYSFFRRYVVHLNFDEQIISVYSPGRYQYPKKGVFLNPSFANIPVTRHEIGDARSFFSNFYLDTGAGLCVLLTTQFVQDSSFLRPGRKKVSTQVEGLAGKINMHISVMKYLHIGKYRFKKVPIHIYNDSLNVLSYPYLVGLLGNDLLRRFNMVINYPEKQIHLTPNSHFRERFDYSYTGMSMYFIDNKVIVTEVQQGSPADKAGLQPGDVIFGINGNFSNNILQYKSMLQQPGQRYSIIIFRNGQPRMIQLRVGSILR